MFSRMFLVNLDWFCYFWFLLASYFGSTVSIVLETQEIQFGNINYLGKFEVISQAYIWLLNMILFLGNKTFKL